MGRDSVYAPIFLVRPRRIVLQQGTADASSCDHNSNAGASCGGKPQEDIFTPEFRQPSNGSSSGAPCSDEPDRYPKQHAQQQGHWVRTRIGDRSPDEQQAWAGYHRADEAYNGT